MNALLTPFQLGPLSLPNRLVMAPLTRSRHVGQVPTALAPTYYAQRASAGLIVAEASQVTPRGQGYPDTPGIYTDEHVAAWRAVTDLVHAVGGRIVLQLWHVGRVSHSSHHGGALPVAPSALPAVGQAMTPDFRLVPFETPHALSEPEIADVVAAYGEGARRAREAGFDGVEIHGANGYLIEQFLSSGSNTRTDGYGGSVANRARLLDEVTAAVLGEWPADRVGVRLSFGQGASGVVDADPAATFAHVARRMQAAGLAYLHAIRPNSHTRLADGGTALDVVALAREHFSGALIASGDFSPEEAERTVAEGRADLIAFGRDFLATPDLPIRLAAGAPLNAPDRATFYGGGARGYTDYPIWDGTLD
ncbi:MAG TPA: alkene reductase [Rubricoccaceae bacterium]|jgi:N-ethylmaleimide reductase